MTAHESNRLVSVMAEKYAIDPGNLLQTLKATAFSQKENDIQISDEQMVALLVVSNQYDLNPFTREIYAFPDKRGGIIPVVGVDGWNRIANKHPQFDGVSFVYSETLLEAAGALAPCHSWIEVILYRKDRDKPICVREYLDECYRAPFTDPQTGFIKYWPWQTHPKRLLRHKGLIQCYRIGFGFAGIFDEDEAHRILESQSDRQERRATVIPMAPIRKTAPVHSPPKSLSDTSATQFDQAEVDVLLKKLFERAKASNQWQAAEEYIGDRLNGQAAIYAKQALKNFRQQSTNDADDSQGESEQCEVLDAQNSTMTLEDVDQGHLAQNTNQNFI